MKRHKCTIRPDGTMVFVYDDSMEKALRPLIDAAQEQVTCRVSDVEMDEDRRWVADLSKVGGPKSEPFEYRQDAKDWEVEWLNANIVK